jgi:SAM-dependent methyltransferase
MDRSQLKRFWDGKARRYPLPFQPKTYQGTLGILEMIKQRGVSFREKTVLDLGCGTGVFTLPLAQEASFVLGIDCSEEMIGLLKNEAEKYGIKNVGTRNAFWQDLDPEVTGLRKAFDIGFAAMTAAVKSKEDVLKLEDCSREWVVYIGWGRKRENSLMREIFALHGLELKSPGGSMMVGSTLQELGRDFQFEFFESSWDWEGTVDEALEDLSGFIQMEGRVPQRERILQILQEGIVDGKIRHTTFVEQGLVIWKPK